MQRFILSAALLLALLDTGGGAAATRRDEPRRFEDVDYEKVWEER
jgi:hypothetical protein